MKHLEFNSFSASQNYRKYIIDNYGETVFTEIYGSIDFYNTLSSKIKGAYFYIWNNNITWPKCICGKETKFKSIKVGFSKTCCETACVNQNNSTSKRGENNPVHRQTKETKEKTKIKQSITMKEKIRNGTFTPCITNSWAKSLIEIELNNKNYKFRSSWEAFFFLLHNGELQYEKIRIPYIIDNVNRIYITDFYDEINNIIYEIKPDSEKNIPLVLIKEQAALEYCNNNGLTYKIISNDYFINQLDTLREIALRHDVPALNKSLLAFERESNKYENKKNRNI